MVVLQVFMLFVLCLSIWQSLYHFGDLFNGITIAKLKDLLFSLCTFVLSLAVVGIIQISMTGIL